MVLGVAPATAGANWCVVVGLLVAVLGVLNLLTFPGFKRDFAWNLLSVSTILEAIALFLFAAALVGLWSLG